MPGSSILEPEFLRKLHGLSLVAKKVFAGQLKGDKRSLRRGASVEFTDYREYAPGDDLRYVDWNLYARLEKMFLKLFVEEEDLNVYFILDASRSMAFGEPHKIEYARRVAAALGYIGLAHHDRVSVSAIGNGPVRQMPSVRGTAQAMRYFDVLAQFQAEGPGRLAESLKEFAQRASRTGVAVILSDLLDPDYEAGLKALAYRKFQAVVVHILDESETHPPYVGDLKLVDSETGETREVTMSQGFLNHYRKTLDSFLARAQGSCMRYGMDYLRTTTSVPFEELILKYFRKIELLR
ncbi:MAG: DUF58 domain-containing protein [Armatimonadetes bacterium]|nr:DUF58 domain-containing protein [Armatimonadota bacterium]